MARKQSRRKIGKIELTDEQREIIARNVDSEFFKVIVDVIIPQRVIQLALTAIAADQTETELFYHKGMVHVCDWFPGFITGEAEKVDTTDYGNDDDGPDAEDDDLTES